MKKGLVTLIGGIVLLIIGGFVVPAAVIIPFIASLSDNAQFVVPGEMTVNVTDPGRYYLWNDYQTVFKGKSYNRSDALPDGLEIAIRNAAGEVLEFTSNTSITSSSGSNSSKSIGYVDIEAPVTLTVSVTGDANPLVFSFSRSIIMKLLVLIFGGIGLSAVIGLTGLGITIWGIIKLATNKDSSSIMNHS